MKQEKLKWKQDETSRMDSAILSALIIATFSVIVFEIFRSCG